MRCARILWGVVKGCRSAMVSLVSLPPGWGKAIFCCTAAKNRMRVQSLFWQFCVIRCRSFSPAHPSRLCHAAFSSSARAAYPSRQLLFIAQAKVTAHPFRRASSPHKIFAAQSFCVVLLQVAEVLFFSALRAFQGRRSVFTKCPISDDLSKFFVRRCKNAHGKKYF